MKKILVATDGSEAGTAAADVGLDLAAEEGAEIIFAHVVSVLDFAPNLDDRASIPQRVPRAESDEVLQEALGRARARGVTASIELLVGHPSSQIVRLGHNVHADLIVVGSRGLGRFKSTVLGSTSREILAHADRPVVVVRGAPIREDAPAAD